MGRFSHCNALGPARQAGNDPPADNAKLKLSIPSYLKTFAHGGGTSMKTSLTFLCFAFGFSAHLLAGPQIHQPESLLPWQANRQAAHEQKAMLLPTPRTDQRSGSAESSQRLEQPAGLEGFPQLQREDFVDLGHIDQSNIEATQTTAAPEDIQAAQRYRRATRKQASSPARALDWLKAIGLGKSR
jgi:hypothetical protein